MAKYIVKVNGDRGFSGTEEEARSFHLKVLETIDNLEKRFGFEFSKKEIELEIWDNDAAFVDISSLEGESKKNLPLRSSIYCLEQIEEIIPLSLGTTIRGGWAKQVVSIDQAIAWRKEEIRKDNELIDQIIKALEADDPNTIAADEWDAQDARDRDLDRLQELEEMKADGITRAETGYLLSLNTLKKEVA